MSGELIHTLRAVGFTVFTEEDLVHVDVSEMKKGDVIVVQVPVPPKRVVIFDFETTGLTLHPRANLDVQPRAIEFGAVLLCDGEIEDELSILINPEQPISEEITKITGLTQADVEGQPTFAQAWPQIRALFGRAAGMIAHNLPFDRAVLAYELKRMNAEPIDWPSPLCTAQLYQEAYGRRLRLIELYEEVMGVPLAQTHRASDDCRALAAIVIKERLWEMV